MDIAKAITFITEDPRWKEKMGMGMVVVVASAILSIVLVGILGFAIVTGYSIRLLQNVRDGQPLPDRTVVEVGGIVTHRQQPETAKGVVFVNLEDETGLVNVICTPDVWKRFRTVARGSPALVVRGMLERRYDVVNLVARRIEPLSLRAADLMRSRDFH